jgi:hypothetical protein
MSENTVLSKIFGTKRADMRAFFSVFSFYICRGLAVDQSSEF